MNTRSTPRRRLSVEDRRVEILEAAVTVFEQLPYEQVSVEAIAEAAQISMGLLYHYFPGKKALFLAAYEHLATGLVQRCMAQVTEAGAASKWEAVEACLEAYYDYAREHPGAVLMILRPGVGADEEISAFNDRLNEQMADLLSLLLDLRARATATRVALLAWTAFVDKAILEIIGGARVDRARFTALAVKVLLAALG